jgi:pimeloyl-ACP methyl ester carboxylesterase
MSLPLRFDPQELESEDIPPFQLDDETNSAAAEAIPLPWPLKKPLMRAFVRDAHHYLFNVEHTPRDGETYFVRDEIRKRFVTRVQKSAAKGPVIVFSHSLGTVIAFDCLKNVPECPEVQQLITIGSPLGMSEMQDKLEPGYSADDGFPHEKLTGSWVNVFDPVDIVSISDPILRNDYLQSGHERVTDIRQKNGGLWTHGLLKYAAQSELRTALRSALESV